MSFFKELFKTPQQRALDLYKQQRQIDLEMEKEAMALRLADDLERARAQETFSREASARDLNDKARRIAPSFMGEEVSPGFSFKNLSGEETTIPGITVGSKPGQRDPVANARLVLGEAEAAQPAIMSNALGRSLGERPYSRSLGSTGAQTELAGLGAQKERSALDLAMSKNPLTRTLMEYSLANQVNEAKDTDTIGRARRPYLGDTARNSAVIESINADINAKAASDPKVQKTMLAAAKMKPEALAAQVEAAKNSSDTLNQWYQLRLGTPEKARQTIDAALNGGDVSAMTALLPFMGEQILNPNSINLLSLLMASRVEGDKTPVGGPPLGPKGSVTMGDGSFN